MAALVTLQPARRRRRENRGTGAGEPAGTVRGYLQTGTRPPGAAAGQTTCQVVPCLPRLTPGTGVYSDLVAGVAGRARGTANVRCIAATPVLTCHVIAFLHAAPGWLTTQVSTRTQTHQSDPAHDRTMISSTPVCRWEGGECPTPEPARPPDDSPPAARKHRRKRRAPAGDSADEGKYELCEDDREWIARTASRLGPLTDRQRDTLARLLRTRR